MDIFGSALNNEFGEDFEDLMQIIDDYLDRPRGSEQPELNVIHNARRISERATARTPDDDDVIYVSSEPSGGPPAVDLLSPIINSGLRRNRRRRADEEMISLDDSCTEPKVPKRTNSTGTCSHAQNESQSRNSESEGTGLKLKCVVCMEDPIKNEPTTTICGHIFCKECIYKAIKISKKCPLCNKKINLNKQVHRVYF